MKTLTVSETAKILDVSELTLRVMIQQGLIPIGEYVRRKGRQRGNYIIWKEKVDEFVKGRRDSDVPEGTGSES